MKVVGRFAAFWLVPAVLVACTKAPESDTDPEVVLEPPTVECVIPESAVELTAIPVSCTATDPDGVYSMTMYYRSGDVATWRTAYLERSEADETKWTGEIAAFEVKAPQVELYIKATDNGDPRTTGYIPEDGPDTPFTVPVSIVARPLPFYEDFEGAATATLFDLGWDVESEAFEGYVWGVQEGRATSGSIAVVHRRGVDGLDPLIDWLISPPLDFSTVTSAQVTWQEYGDYADTGAHSLWIGPSPDPTDGTWTMVTTVPNPSEDAWDRTAVIDLSAYAGLTPQWLAWRYEGQFADDWYIDDVSVRELTADIWDTAFTWSPDPVDPGETVTVTFDLENRTAVPAVDVTGTWAIDASYGTIADPVVSVDVEGSSAFQLSTDIVLSPDVLDNSYVPVSLTLTDGTDTWTFDGRLTVGVPTTAEIVVQTDAFGLVTATLGVGDPDAPDYSTSMAAEIVDAGEHTWTVDLTGLPDHLPPAAGADRWWVQINSAETGRLESFTISYDGVSYESDDTGSLEAATERTFYLPRPPAPAIVSSSTSPTRVAPGDTVSWTVNLENDGAATSGDTWATLTSSDPDVTVVSGGPVQIASGGWAEGATASATFSFVVSSSHVDSSDVGLTVTISDSVESFDLSGGVDVPWPVLQVTAVRIDDWATGDDDGLLDPDEVALLQVDLTNMGGLDAFGPVKCTLAQDGGTATATITQKSASFGLVVAGSTKTDKNLEIEAKGSAVGDTLEMRMDCTDGKQTYTPTFVLVVGEPPWLTLGKTDDPVGDNLSDYEFDFVNGRYRSDGVTLDIELDSAVPYDDKTVFIEAWMQSIGADQTYYQLVIQGEKAKLRGYDFGTWTTLAAPTLTFADEDTLDVSLDLASMDLALDNATILFGAGFCSGDDYYCDHFPDDWGDPYVVGFPDDSEWLSMTW